MKKLVTTPLSNTIWWATVNEKSGTMNTSTRVDVTDNAVDAVFQHLINLEGFTENGFAGYEIPKKNSNEPVTMAVFSNNTHVCVSKKLFDELKEYKAMYDGLSK